MQQEITTAIELFRKALELQDALLLDPEYLEFLDTMHDRLERHWTEAYGDLEKRGRLLMNLAFFQRFLTRTLLEDYNGQPYSPSPFSLHCASLIRRVNNRPSVSDDEKESSGGDEIPATNDNNQVLANDDASSGPSDDSDSDSNKSDTLLEEYAKDVLDPLEELLLDEHLDAIKNKLLAFEPERRYPGGEIQRLIDQCDWHGLFAAINGDRRLAIDLFRQRPVVSGAFKEHTKGTVWSGMDKTRDKYFTLSKDGDKYIISKYARGLSSKKELVSGNISKSSHPTSMSTHGEDSEGASWRGVKSLFKTFASGLAGGSRDAASRTKAHLASGTSGPNEKDPLLHQEDQLIDLEKAE